MYVSLKKSMLLARYQAIVSWGHWRWVLFASVFILLVLHGQHAFAGSEDALDMTESSVNGTFGESSKFVLYFKIFLALAFAGSLYKGLWKTAGGVAAGFLVLTYFGSWVGLS